jgi:hypothetical protein
LLGQLGALALDVRQAAILVARDAKPIDSAFSDRRSQSWREVKSMAAIEPKPPDAIGFAGIGPVADAVFFIVLSAETTEGEITVDSDVAEFIVAGIDSEKRMTFGYSDVSAPIAGHLASDCQARQSGIRILPLDLVRFFVPWTTVPTGSIDDVSVFNRFHSFSVSVSGSIPKRSRYNQHVPFHIHSISFESASTVR